MSATRPRKKARISLAEVLIMTIFGVLIVGAAVPTMGRLELEATADEIIAVVERLRDPCDRHQTDTGRLALEFAAPAEGHSYGDSRYHHLGMTQSYPGWKGPYLDQPLSRADNPCGGGIYLRRDLDDAPAVGFDLIGGIGDLTLGHGQYVVFENVPRHIARLVDDRLDGTVVPAYEEGWLATGRVEWTPASGGSLSVFIMSL